MSQPVNQHASGGADAAPGTSEPDHPATDSGAPVPAASAGPAPRVQRGTPVDRPALVAPSRDDPVVRSLSEVVGGPVGPRLRAGAAALWTPTRVCVVLAVVTMVAALALKQHCRTTGWASPDQFTHLCYSDVSALFGSRGLADKLFPYVGHPGVEQVEYPVLTGLLMWATAKVVPGSGYSVDRLVTYFDVNLLADFALLLVAVLATAWTARRRRWDAAIVAASPAVAMTATINWDLLAVALTAVAMLLWARDRPVAAGVLLGLGVAAKLYPVLLLGPLLVLCLRAGRLRAWTGALAGTAASWLAVNLWFILFARDGWARFYALSRERGAGFSSIFYVTGSGWWTAHLSFLNAVATLVMLLACAGIAWLALAAPRRPRVGSLAFLVVAAFLLTNKVYSPQYALWLVPLLALARPRWRDVLIWQACEAVHWVAIWLYIAGFTANTRGLPRSVYDATVWLHVAGLLWLVAMVVRDVLHPEHDPVRADGVDDDPAGGPLDGAPDVVVLDGTRLVRVPADEPGPAVPAGVS
ncbi:MAG TPA: glycosyltransferase 87 family protein [Motilibacteraceae bacterium]|nr:glycosyltransferase 87 family protein [Motilibacteraceae bacterium]